MAPDFTAPSTRATETRIAVCAEVWLNSLFTGTVQETTGFIPGFREVPGRELNTLYDRAQPLIKPKVPQGRYPSILKPPHGCDERGVLEKGYMGRGGQMCRGKEMGEMY